MQVCTAGRGGWGEGLFRLSLRPHTCTASYLVLSPLAFSSFLLFFLVSFCSFFIFHFLALDSSFPSPVYLVTLFPIVFLLLSLPCPFSFSFFPSFRFDRNIVLFLLLRCCSLATLGQGDGVCRRKKWTQMISSISLMDTFSQCSKLGATVIRSGTPHT